MKKIIILLSLSASVLLTGCGAVGSVTDLYSEKYGDDWFASTS